MRQKVNFMQANERKFILCCLMLFFSLGAFAQQINVTGSVNEHQKAFELNDYFSYDQI